MYIKEQIIWIVFMTEILGHIFKDKNIQKILIS
jgi:hypothetical protein